MLQQFSAMVEKLYAAAADPSLWGDALRAVEDYTGCTGAVLNMVPRASTALPSCLAGSFSESDCADYAANYMWRCPRIAFGEAHPDVPIHFDRMILTESEMDRDATYEWYGKHGLRYYIAGWIGETDTHRAYMSLQRSRRQGHVDLEEVEQFALVRKHMEQALSLAVKLGTLDQQHRFNLALIDSLAHAVFALDAAGRVLLANSAAERLLIAADGLVVCDGRLQTRDGRNEVLERLISAALQPMEGEARGGWTTINRESGQKALAAFVTAVPGCEFSFGLFQPKVLVIVTDPTHVATASQSALQELFGLSPAEALLAGALAGGHSIESASALLGIKDATARSELKSVFRKTGVNRQQDLVRLLTSLSMIGGRP